MRLYRKRKGGQAVAVIAIVMALAMAVSFTLAWFMQELKAPEQRVSAAGKDGSFLELWAQTPIGSEDAEGNPTGLYGSAFSAVSTFTTGAAITVTPSVTVTEGYAGRTKVQDPATRIECEQVTPDTLYPLVTRSRENGGLVLQDPTKAWDDPDNDYNRLLNESGFLPGNSIKRRLLVRNTGGVEMSYLLSFEGLLFDDADYLAEAIRVDTRRVSFDENRTELAYDAARDGIPELSGLGAEELPEAKLAGTLGAATKTDGSFEPDACDVYEFTFTFAESATVIYAQKAFQADVKVDAQGILPIRYVGTADELSALLGAGNAALPQGTKIVLTNDIAIDTFVTDKLVSIDLGGHTLTVTGKFVIDVAKVDGADPFGTIDIGMAETKLADGTASRGSLIVQEQQGGIPAIGVRAPNAAVRWNPDAAAFTQPNMDKVDARLWNGAKALNPSAELPY